MELYGLGLRPNKSRVQAYSTPSAGASFPNALLNGRRLIPVYGLTSNGRKKFRKNSPKSKSTICEEKCNFLRAVSGVGSQKLGDQRASLSPQLVPLKTSRTSRISPSGLMTLGTAK
eukprot:scaffold23695_cov147-Cylindrotheca_fusiformis.AAC.1